MEGRLTRLAGRESVIGWRRLRAREQKPATRGNGHATRKKDRCVGGKGDD